MRAFAIKLLLVLFPLAVLAQDAPVKGDDWISLLGQRNTAPAVAKVLSYIGDNGNPKGLKVTVQDSKVTRVDFFNKDNPWGADIKRFEGVMPKGITFDNNIAQCKKLLGEGFEFEGEISETYTLHKNFEMNSEDAYQINLEFLTGTLNSVALVLIPGGAKKFTQSGEENKTGIDGDDFLWLIKKNQYNKTYQDMQAAIGPPNVEERQTHIFANGGVEVLFDEGLNISSITFFSGGQAISKGHIKTYQPFTLPLPFGIKFGDSQQDIISKAGQPSGTGEDGSMEYKQDYAQLNVGFSAGKVVTVRVSLNKDYKFEKPAPKAPKKPASPQPKLIKK